MKVYILPEVHAQIMHYVHKSSIEISGLGRVQKNSKGEMVVTKVYLLEQENSSATTDIDEEAVAKLMYETREDAGDLNFWWHSHVNMGVFWSSTDMGTIEDFGRKGYLLATVFNKKGEHRTAYLQGENGFLPEIFVDNIDTTFSHIPTKTEVETWDKEYEEKCKEKKWSSHLSSSWYGRNWSGYGKDYDWQEDLERFSNECTPSNHKDKSFYTVTPKESASGIGEKKSPRESGTTQTQKSFEEQKLLPIGGNTHMTKYKDVIGTKTKHSLQDLEDSAWEMFDSQVETAFELPYSYQLVLADIYEIVHGPEGTVDQLEMFYEEISTSYTQLGKAMRLMYASALELAVEA